MKLKGLVAAVGALMLVSPFASAGNPVQMWKCNIHGDVAEEGVMAQQPNGEAQLRVHCRRRRHERLVPLPSRCWR